MALMLSGLDQLNELHATMDLILRRAGHTQDSVGTRFDLRDFNDTVVKGGNVPLDVLALNIDEYCATTLG